MRYLLVLFLSACMFTNRPIDVIGPGIYCEPINPDVQQCTDRYGTRWICDVRGGTWHCEQVAPMLRGYTKW
jgi:hypothetical protein